jgi:hypothetical protein
MVEWLRSDLPADVLSIYDEWEIVPGERVFFVGTYKLEDEPAREAKELKERIEPDNVTKAPVGKKWGKLYFGKLAWHQEGTLRIKVRDCLV